MKFIPKKRSGSRFKNRFWKTNKALEPTKVIRRIAQNITIIAIRNIVCCVVSGPALFLLVFLYPVLRPSLRPLMSSHEKLRATNGKKPRPKEMPPADPLPPPNPPKSEFANEVPLLKLAFGSGADL